MRKILIVASSILIISCCNLFGQQIDDESIVGTFQGDEYVNRALGFKFKVPPKWYVPTKEQMAKYVELGVKEFGASSKIRYEKIEFAIAKKKVGSTENSLLGYSLIKQPSSSTTARAVSEITRDHFLKTPQVRLTRDIATERLGNRDFVTFELGFTNFPKQRVRTYMLMSDIYLITFALTYWDDDSLKVMMDSLKTIEFQSK